MQIVGLVGASYCGSTVVSAALATLPGVIAPGEVHWLLDPNPHLATYLCRHHREACTRLPVGLRQGATAANAYARLDQALGPATVLVTSDKSWWQFRRYPQLPSFCLLLTRDPVTHVASLAKAQDDVVRSHGTEADCLAIWAAFYRQEVALLQAAQVPFVHVSLEAFAANPQGALRWLAEVAPAGLWPLPSAAPTVTPDYCHIGGNPGAYASPALDPAIPGRRQPRQLAPAYIRACAQAVAALIDGLAVPHWGKVSPCP